MESTSEEVKPTTQIEEEKKTEMPEVPKKAFEPVMDLKKAMDELHIDYTDPDFTVEKLKEAFQNKLKQNLPHLERDRFNHLLNVVGEHRFWNAQPIMKPTEKIAREGMIQQFSAKDIPTEPLALPEGFYWETFDATDDAEALEICDFLQDHYVESSTGDFKLIYTVERFRWAVLPPGYIKDLHTLVRSTKTKKIMATNLTIPKKMVVHGQNQKMAENNFLAVHQNLRDKRMA